MVGADRQNSVNIDPGPEPTGRALRGSSMGAFVHWQQLCTQPAIEGPGPVLLVGERDLRVT